MHSPPRRITFARALRIAGYNWPLYAGAAVAIAVGVLLACLPQAPAALRWVGAAGALVAVWGAVASFWAFHAMFDRSELLDGRWLADEVPQPPGRWIQVNAGLEETTLPMADVFPAAEGKTLDLYNPAVMTEPAVTRARQHNAGVTAVAVTPESLPVEDGWADLVVVTLAAHEIRDASQRQRFFEELRRVVSPAGRVIVIEHLRDLPAALAFGPGIIHFFPRGEWLGLASHAGMELARERRMTPFIRVFVFRRSSE